MEDNSFRTGNQSKENEVTKPSTARALIIGNSSQTVHDYIILVNGQEHVAHNDGQFHRCGMMRAKTARDLANLIIKRCK